MDTIQTVQKRHFGYVFSNSTSEQQGVEHWCLRNDDESEEASIAVGCQSLFVSVFDSQSSPLKNVMNTWSLKSALDDGDKRVEILKVFARETCVNNQQYLQGFLLKAIDENVDDILSKVKAIVSCSSLTWFKLCDDIVESCSWNIDVKGMKYRTVLNNVQYNPIFDFQEYHSVFHSYKQALTILNQFKGDRDVAELLEIFSNRVDYDFDVKMLQSSLKYPFVVVEGLDGTGKSTLTEHLANLLGAYQLHTPPPYILHVRRHFDKLPEIVRRTFFCLGNYLVVKDIVEKCQTGPVIMDRFWHSSAAYAMTDACSIGDEDFIPPRRHPIYRWPTDLLKPDLVLFLTVSEDIRTVRIRGRNMGPSREEQRLEANILFRRRLLEAYRRMDEPQSVEIDANQSKEQVVSAAVKTLSDHNILNNKLQ